MPELNRLQDKPVIKTLTDYIDQQATTISPLSPIADLLKPSNPAQVGLVLTERLINIPSEVVPPMYKMLLEEISWAVEEKEPYSFSHYLILSKTYREITSTLEENRRPQKKQKKDAAKEKTKETFYFHPEDEVLQRHATTYGGFSYVKEESDGQADAKRTFQELGIKPQGHMMLLEASKFESAVKALEECMQPT